MIVSDLVTFIHQPKCGGTTVEELLLRHLVHARSHRSIGLNTHAPIRALEDRWLAPTRFTVQRHPGAAYVSLWHWSHDADGNPLETLAPFLVPGDFKSTLHRLLYAEEHRFDEPARLYPYSPMLAELAAWRVGFWTWSLSYLCGERHDLEAPLAIHALVDTAQLNEGLVEVLQRAAVGLTPRQERALLTAPRWNDSSTQVQEQDPANAGLMASYDGTWDRFYDEESWRWLLDRESRIFELMGYVADHDRAITPVHWIREGSLFPGWELDNAEAAG